MSGRFRARRASGAWDRVFAIFYGYSPYARSGLGAETLLLGDTVYDMEMAVAAGVRAFGAGWGYHEPHELSAAGAYRVLTRIGELPTAMGDLE